MAFPSQENDCAFPLRLFWVALILRHVVQAEHGSKLLFHGGRPAVGLDGLHATSQLLKTKENRKRIEFISIIVKQDIPNCVNTKANVLIRGLNNDLE